MERKLSGEISVILKSARVAVGLICLFVSLPAFAAAEYGLNDLSLLLPLPATQSEYNQMLSSDSPAKGGALIHSNLIRQLPALIVGPSADPAEVTKEALRVLAIRFDPCFRESEEPCRHQIRLVLQPLKPFRNGYLPSDAAVHVFFEFNDGEWRAVVADWKATLVGKRGEPLQVHPLISKQGYTGSHWAKIRALVLKHCGLKNLTRLTMSNVNSFGTMWTFVLFGIESGPKLKPQRISRLQTASQTFFGDLGDLREFFGDVRPAPPADNSDLLKLWQHSVGARNVMREADIQKAVDQALQMENPNKFHTGNLDCVSCHLAQNTRLWGQRNFRTWDWKSMFAGNSYVNANWNLENIYGPDFFTNRVRAFGYFTYDPIVTQRVINETAAVADFMARESSEK